MNHPLDHLLRTGARVSPEKLGTASIAVRRISRMDADILKRIRLKALQEAPSSFTQQLSEVVDKSDSYWSEWASTRATAKDTCVYLAFAGESPIGMCGAYLEKENPQSAQLVAVWLEPAFRGSGMAYRLIDSVIAWARHAAATGITAWVTEDNLRARRFYLRLGFVEQVTRSQSPSGHSEIPMWRRI